MSSLVSGTEYFVYGNSIISGCYCGFRIFIPLCHLVKHNGVEFTQQKCVTTVHVNFVGMEKLNNFSIILMLFLFVNLIKYLSMNILRQIRFG